MSWPAINYVIWMAVAFIVGVELLESLGVHWLLAALIAAPAGHWTYIGAISLWEKIHDLTTEGPPGDR